jgi:hypothetical protein
MHASLSSVVEVQRVLMLGPAQAAVATKSAAPPTVVAERMYDFPLILASLWNRRHVTIAGAPR